MKFSDQFSFPTLIITGIVLSITTFHTVRSILCKLNHSPQHKHVLSWAEITEISMLITSTIHAVIISYAGLRVVTGYDITKDDIVYDSLPEQGQHFNQHYLGVYGGLSVGYFVFDLFAMLVVVRLKECERLSDSNRSGIGWIWVLGRLMQAKGSLVVHHICLILFAPSILSLDFGDFMLGTFYLNEISTPFAHASTVLRIISKRTSYQFENFSKFLSRCVLFSYVLFRVLQFPVIYAIYFYQQSLWNGFTIFRSVRLMKPWCLLGSVACLSFNLFWVNKLYRRAYLRCDQNKEQKKTHRKNKKQ